MNPAAPEQLKIMLVDDDENVRDAIAEMLGRKGWFVKSFSTAGSAIEELKRGAANYDVVVSDINMPGLTGIDFLHMVREASPDIPVVMITGYPSIDIAVDAMKKGAADFLTKPFKSEELEIIIRKAVGEARVVASGGKDAPQQAARPKRQVRSIASLPEAARARLEEKIKELSILHTITETLDGVNEKDGIFAKTMDLAQIITGTDRSFVLQLDHDGRFLAVTAASGYDDPMLVGKRFASDEEPFRSVIKGKNYSYVRVDRDELAPLVKEGAQTPGERSAHSMMLAPMLINREVGVMLGLVRKGEEFNLTNDELSLLLNLTAKASLKLENLSLNEKIFLSIIGAIKSLINALDARDTYTKEHSNRVTHYALEIARTMNTPQEVVDSIRFAGPLHDIGKIGVRDEILLKRGSFTMEENTLMMTHVLRGEEILRPLNLLDSEKAVVLYHHERWDGTGYPNGLSGSDIPLVARIFSIADTFDAMTTTRPYRNALGREIARGEITKCSGSQFDPEIVEAFLASRMLEDKP